MAAIVTKTSLHQMLQNASDDKRMHIIGRALVALFKRQTQDERSSDSTQSSNNIGFAGCDARAGSIAAKTYLKNGYLMPWQVEVWMQESRGAPRICKYSRQLNEIAEEKRIRVANKRLAALRQEYGMLVDSDDPALIEPVVREMRQLELELGVEPYMIVGAIA